jgi:recombination protein RecA
MGEKDKKKSKKDKEFDPKKQADNALDEIKKKFGDGSIIRGEMVVKDIESISTGCMSLDIAIGIGGFPRGRICEIFGTEGSGKTTIALETIAQAQKAGGIAAFIDVEHALDFQYAQKLGVDVQELMISQPDSAEEALSIAEILCQSNGVDLIVVDSVAALVPKAELEGEMGDHHIGAQARLMSQSLRKMKGIVNTSKTAMVFINQIREKTGVFFGNPETTPGGRALKFYASVRVELRRISTVKGKEGEDPIGHMVRAKVIKNKVAPPFRKAEFEITYTGHGVNKSKEIVELGEKCGIIKKSGSWYSYGENRLGQGVAAASEFFDSNPDFAEELKEMIFDLKLPLRRKEDDDTCTEVQH